MNKEVYEIDVDGYVIETYPGESDVPIPEGCITIQLPHPNYYRPKWTGEEWVEGATPQEIEEMIKPDPQPPSNEDRIAMLEDTILFILGGM